MANSIAQRVGQTDVRSVARRTAGGVARHDLLTFGSAVAFQIATAIPPLAMCSLALAGAFGFESVWTRTVAPQLKSNVSPDVFSVIDHAARAALTAKAGFWVTAGIALTRWEVSGAVRALMSALSRVYGDDDHRPRTRRYLISFALSVAVVAIPLAVLAVMSFGGHYGLVTAILRWPAALVLLAALVWLIQRFAPDHPRAHHLVSFGTAICVAAWLGTSIVFGFYVSNVAAYSSIFSSLAVAFVALLYLYVSACAFLIGAEVDAVLAREDAQSSSS